MNAMKKTVSWSAETIKRKETPNVVGEIGDGQDVNDLSIPMTKSSSVSAPLTLTSPQVNLRIQQMIAMQKAQNATMRQLISTEPGATSASPSGLRDMVTYASEPKAMEGDVQGASSRMDIIGSEKTPPSNLLVTSSLGGASKVEPMKPPAPIQKLPTESSSIHFQAARGSHQPPPQSVPPQKREVCSPPLTNLPHLHPAIPNCEDSPISYNSVLHQNDFPRSRTHNDQIKIDMDSMSMEVQVDENEKNEASETYPTVLDNMNTTTIRECSQNRSVPDPHDAPYDCPENNLAIPSLGFHSTQPQPESNPLVPHTQHNFHYGTNDFDSYRHQTLAQSNQCSHETPDDTSPKTLQLRIRRRRREILLSILCYPFQCLFNSEQLCRSLCFGAIDGMLTGAGILSACVGLELFSQLVDERSNYIKWIPVALTLSATFSEGICMAVGHAWSTCLAANAAHEERKKELKSFEISRSDAKARLVDVLLSQGLLKIDAMSLADTLEGYPEIFVNTLLGGECVGGFGMVHSASESSALPRQHTHQWDIQSLSNGPGVGRHGQINYESYCDVSDCADLDMKILSETVAESKLEGMVMMLSFSSFSAIPSLIYTLSPRVANIALENESSPYDYLPIYISLCIASIVMFFLGAWKSHFYSSNWYLFGFKNMGILVICVSTSYSVARACRVLIGS